MAKNPGFSLALLTASAVLTSTLVAGLTSYLIMDRTLCSHFQQAASDSSSLLASRVEDELRTFGEHARFYVATGDPRRFEADSDLIALSVVRKPVQLTDENTDWEVLSRWTRPSGDPAHLEIEDVQTSDLKHPLDFDRVSQGQADVVFGTAKNLAPFLRIALPYGPKTGQGYEQAIVAEVKASRILALFSESRGLFSFLVGPQQQLLVASEIGHFLPAEDLSHLPILIVAKDAKEPHGDLEYPETPEASPQYAAFSRVNFQGTPLTVVSQAERARITGILSTFVETYLGIALALSLVAGLFAWIRFRHTPQPRTDSQPSAKIIPLAKFRDPGLRSKLQKGTVRLTGERMNAWVVHAHLHGLIQILTVADPEKLLAVLNAFNQVVTNAVEEREGFVDHIHGGSVVACWGVPFSQNEDATHALESCLKIREAVTQLNHSLKGEGIPPLTLGMAMHYGPVVAGQVGSDDRLEYSALGEAIEFASRIQSYTHQFGTDFLMTAQAVERLPEHFGTERVTAGDEETPELFELAA